MEVAVDNDIAGMVAECGGACACATCHTYIDAAWLSRMPPLQDMEDAMLDSALDRRENSRLSCQIEVSDALDGLVVTVADNAA
jgi:2Fe-2S ferredoxin